MAAKLYVILGSHACRTGMLLMEHKGVEYETVTLPTALHPFLLRLRGFGGNSYGSRRVDGGTNPLLGTASSMGTVPSLRLDGRKVKTNRAIARFLDELKPDPPLFPSDPERRAAVEEAESWADEVLQMAARRLAFAAVLRGPGAFDLRDDGRLGTLLWRSRRVRAAGVRFVAVVFRANKRTEPDLLAQVPGMLDRIDAWIEAGVLGGEQLNAADFMIAPCLAVLWYCLDLRPQIEGRPVFRLMDRLLPEPSAA